ncbi:MAG: ATP-dependent zinc metalloprotease FtsH [Ignavibacteria bacterium]|nr:ATP-dependent zinc metalloprotease FtsH [Ignavibacteria bacterium]
MAEQDKNKNQLPKKNNDFNWNRVARIVLLWTFILIGLYFLVIYTKGTDSKSTSITYDQFLKLLDSNKIQSAEIKIQADKSYEFIGKLKQPEPIEGKSVMIERISVLLPNDDDLIKKIREKGISPLEFKSEESGWFNVIMNILPWVLIIGFWIFLMRRMNASAGNTKGIFSFGKSRAKMMSESSVKVTFEDVAGADEAKQELEEIIEFLKNPAKFQKLGGKIPRGVLLLGPPGTGKTLLARAVAGEAGVPFFSISGADFVEMFVGVGASRVRDLFEQGKKNSPCIIFIDEIDAVGRHRGAGLGGGHDEREQTLNQLLIEMDGFEQNSGVIVIAATNRPDILDPALLRPGRFDRHVVVDFPDVKGREGILKVHTRKIPLAPDVRLDVIAKGTPGFSGADLANLVNEAALMAARNNSEYVTMKDLENAKDKVLMGTERRSIIISEKEKRTTAYHEAGHVLVAKMIPEADPVHKVTIIPRGRALGVTTYLPMDEKHTYSKEYLEAMIAYAMGGRAAEKLVFNEYTTGAKNDIDRATALARKMVCDYGMSEKLGPVAYGNKEEEVFLGKEIYQHKNYSEATQVLIDEEVKKTVQAGMDRAYNILKNNIDKLHALVEALLEREILDSEEIDKVLRGEPLPPPQSENNDPYSGVKDKSDKKEKEEVKN